MKRKMLVFGIKNEISQTVNKMEDLFQEKTDVLD